MTKYISIPKNITQTEIDQLKGQPKEIMTWFLKTHGYDKVDQEPLLLEMNSHQTDGQIFKVNPKGPISRTFEFYRSAKLEKGGLVAKGFLAIEKTESAKSSRVAELEQVNDEAQKYIVELENEIEELKAHIKEGEAEVLEQAETIKELKMALEIAEAK
jgi:hypothetical protein